MIAKSAMPINIRSNVNVGEKYHDRKREGKTAKDKASGSHKARFANREKPIRQTSSHRQSGQDNRGVEFWGG